MWSALKWEGGVHRVQRVPATESQGRIHTSAAGVLVTPEVEDPRSRSTRTICASTCSGRRAGRPDRQHHRLAVRITHLPTGIVVSCQNERSQLQNKDRAMGMLRAKLRRWPRSRPRRRRRTRGAQVRTVDRSERIRTYNFPQNRISDHRIGYTAYNLTSVLDGELGRRARRPDAADRAEQLSR